MRDTDDHSVTSFPLTHCRLSFLFLFPKLSARGQQPSLHVLMSGSCKRSIQYPPTALRIHTGVQWDLSTHVPGRAGTANSTHTKYLLPTFAGRKWGETHKHRIKGFNLSWAQGLDGFQMGHSSLFFQAWLWHSGAGMGLWG